MSRRRFRLELAAVAVFAVVQLTGPFVAGECFPFTTAPMFSDAPAGYVRYRITDAAGRELSLEQFGLQLVYDGNPPGLGVGRVPSPTLHPFGEWLPEEAVSTHVREVLRRDPALPRQVAVERELVRAGTGGRLRTERSVWSVRAP